MSVLGTHALIQENFLSREAGGNLLITGLAVMVAAIGLAWKSAPRPADSTPPTLKELCTTYDEPKRLGGEVNKAAFAKETRATIDHFLDHLNNQHLGRKSTQDMLYNNIYNVMINQSLNSTQRQEILENIFNNFEKNIAILERRLNNDLAEIGDTFFAGQTIRLDKIQVTGKETHHQAGVPCFLHFTVEGLEKPEQILYKPRDIRPDSAICNSKESIFSIYNQNTAEESLSLPIYDFLPKIDDENGKNYGYVQYLSHEPEDYTFKTPQQAERFFQTMGQLQGMAEIFGIFDLHQENILTHNLQPHPIDLETTLNPHLVDFEKSTALEIAIDSDSGLGDSSGWRLETEEGPLDGDNVIQKMYSNTALASCRATRL